MGPLLLDVNALLALAWPNHQFHGTIVERLERRPLARWATCALTQLGFVRLSANPAAVGRARSPREAAILLGELVKDPQHKLIELLPGIPSLPAAFDRVLGHGQVTDAYLVALARRHRATLLTFDSRLRAIAGADGVVEVPVS